MGCDRFLAGQHVATDRDGRERGAGSDSLAVEIKRNRIVVNLHQVVPAVPPGRDAITCRPGVNRRVGTQLDKKILQHVGVGIVSAHLGQDIDVEYHARIALVIEHLKPGLQGRAVVLGGSATLGLHPLPSFRGKPIVIGEHHRRSVFAGGRGSC